MADKLDFPTLAKKLIELVDGDNSDTNVEGVVKVLTSMVQGINLNWEIWIAEETNEVLMQDKTCCPGCAAPITIIRERNVVYVETV